MTALEMLMRQLIKGDQFHELVELVEDALKSALIARRGDGKDESPSSAIGIFY
jgi:hypothetical protein